MSRGTRTALIAIAMIALILLAGKCAYSAGEFMGAN